MLMTAGRPYRDQSGRWTLQVTRLIPADYQRLSRAKTTDRTVHLLRVVNPIFESASSNLVKTQNLAGTNEEPGTLWRV